MNITLLPFLMGFALGWLVQLLLDFFFWKRFRNRNADGTAGDTRLEASRTKMMKDYAPVALVENDSLDEPPIYHLPAKNQVHSTLCGLAGELDSDGGDPMVGLMHTRVSVPDNVRVNCADCYHIFEVAQGYRIGDFDAKLR